MTIGSPCGRRCGWSRWRENGGAAGKPAAPQARSSSGGLLLRQRSLGALHIGGEGRRLVDGHLGQNLAIDLDPSLAETIDKSGIGQAVLPDRRVETLDPESAGRALLVLTVA